jgi:hypothetical protein
LGKLEGIGTVMQNYEVYHSAMSQNTCMSDRRQLEEAVVYCCNKVTNCPLWLSLLESLDGSKVSKNKDIQILRVFRLFAGAASVVPVAVSAAFIVNCNAKLCTPNHHFVSLGSIFDPTKDIATKRIAPITYHTYWERYYIASVVPSARSIVNSWSKCKMNEEMACICVGKHRDRCKRVAGLDFSLLSNYMYSFSMDNLEENEQ